MKKLVLLDFKGGFRVGRGDESDSTLPTIHSDTIYGAIVYWAFKLYQQEAEAFARSLKTSSLFFKHLDNYAIPKPLIFDTLEVKDPKSLKKADYVFLSKLSLKEPEQSVLEKQPTQLAKIARNALDRNTNAASLYFVEAVYIRPDFTPCIIVECEDKYESMLVSCLKALGDSGIGGDSTYGFGLFDFQIIDLPNEFRRKGSLYTSLSLCIPNIDEIPRLNEGYYKIITKRGYHKDYPMAKVDLHYLVEGSTFPFEIQGRGAVKIEDYFVQTSPVTIAIGGDEP
ncbi:MAG: type III-A CRISPR-associated RAMP protein Csm4 [Pseudothermotoga sp.]